MTSTRILADALAGVFSFAGATVSAQQKLDVRGDLIGPNNLWPGLPKE